jgi:hypothetical protein
MPDRRTTRRSGAALPCLGGAEHCGQFAALAVGAATCWIDWQHGPLTEQPGDAEINALAVPGCRQPTGHPGVPRLLDDVLGTGTFCPEVPGGWLARLAASDRRFGSLTKYPRESCRNAGEVVGILLRELPGRWGGIDIPGPGRDSPLTLDGDRQDVGYLLR